MDYALKLEKIKNVLKEEMKENSIKIDELVRKINALKINLFETRLVDVIGFSIIPWGLSLLLVPNIIKMGITSNFMISVLTIGLPLSIGLVGERLFKKKFKLKERLKEFSNAKKEKEKIAEMTKYEIEKAKLENLNQVLQQGYDSIIKRQDLVKSLSSEFNISEKDKDIKTEEELNSYIEVLTKILTEKQNKIKDKTAKYVLENKFFQVINKPTNVINTMVVSIASGVLSMVIYCLPIIASRVTNLPIEASLMTIFAPLGIGGLTGFGYMLKRNKDYNLILKKVSNDLNLKVNELDDDLTVLNHTLKKLLNDTLVTKLQLEFAKQELETKKTIESSIKSDDEINNFKNIFLAPEDEQLNYSTDLEELKGYSLIKK